MSDTNNAISPERQAELDAAYQAFEAYAAAKRKADASLNFADAHDAAQAWVRFVNLYLASDLEIPTDNDALIEAVGGAA